jgi:hypothetical protein
MREQDCEIMRPCSASRNQWVLIYLADAVEHLESESQEADMKAWKLEGNVAPVAVAAFLLLATNFAKVAFLRSEPPVKRAMTSWAWRCQVVEISV